MLETLPPWAIPVAVTAVLVLLAGWLLLSRRRDLGPPEVPGLPFLGSALALGAHGVSYISKARSVYGDAFTLRLAGQRMTFLFRPEHLDYFFGAPDAEVTFRPAVEQFTQRVFGLTSKLFFPLHGKMLVELRGLLVPALVSEHMQTLGERVLQLLPLYVHHDQVDLYSLCRGLVFHAAVEALFGRPFVASLEEGRGAEGEQQQQQQGGAEGALPAAAAGESQGGQEVGAGGGWAAGWQRPPPGLEQLAREFFTFEEGFELAASPVPHAFQTEFTASRAALLRALQRADARGLFAGTTAGQLLDRTVGLPPKLRPNLLLALLWASQANTVPATFWSVAFLLLPENAAHKEAVLAEIRAEMKAGEAASSTAKPAANGAAGPPPSFAASAPDPLLPGEHCGPALVAAAARLAAQRRSAASRCAAEAVRLRVQSIDVRIAATDLVLPGGAACSSSGGGGGSKGSQEAGGAGGPGGGGGGVRVPKGRILAVCPFESHHSEELYGSGGAGGVAGGVVGGRAVRGEAWRYNPDRPELKLGAGVAVAASTAGLAFGGGPYRCPGRFFAEQELALLMQLLLAVYDMGLSYTDHVAPGPAAHTSDKGGSASREQRQGEPPQEQRQLRRRSAREQSGLVPEAPPQPQLAAVRGGSVLYRAVTCLVAPDALAWGTGWFDGLDDKPLETWRHSGDILGLLPPCNLRRLVGVKVPSKPCWVQVAARGGMLNQN